MDKQNNFTLLRIILAALVIYMHAFGMTGFADNEPVRRFTHGQADCGWIAVNLFLAISGYLVTASLDRTQNIKVFLLSRLLRIYPAFIVALLVSVVVFLPLGGFPVSMFLHSREPLQFIYRPLLLRDVWMHLPNFCVTNAEPFQLNHSIWTIRFEVFMYIALAFAGYTKLLRRPGVIAAMLLALLVAFHGDTIHLNLPYFGEVGEATRLFPYFLSGALFYLYQEKVKYHWTACLACLLVVYITKDAGLSTVFPIVGVYVTLFFAFDKRLAKVNSIKETDLSYGVYLYAFPVAQVLVYHFSQLRNPNLLFGATLVLSTLIAAISWFCIEKPCMSLKKRFSAPAKAKIEKVQPLPVLVSST
jgi:peptidoglycan/LPS O-acetylase OafA/YrhL